MSWNDDDEAETVPCPHCGQDVYEDAERCPNCERYLSREDAPSQRSWTFRIIVIICLIAAIAAAFSWL